MTIESNPSYKSDFQDWKRTKNNIPKRTIMKIQAHPGFPPRPSMFSIPAASIPEKAPDSWEWKMFSTNDIMIWDFIKRTETDETIRAILNDQCRNNTNTIMMTHTWGTTPFGYKDPKETEWFLGASGFQPDQERPSQWSGHDTTLQILERRRQWDRIRWYK